MIRENEYLRLRRGGVRNGEVAAGGSGVGDSRGMVGEENEEFAVGMIILLAVSDYFAYICSVECAEDYE